MNFDLRLTEFRPAPQYDRCPWANSSIRPGISGNGISEQRATNVTHAGRRRVDQLPSSPMAGAPQVYPLAGNPDHHLVEVPSIARSLGRGQSSFELNSHGRLAPAD